MSGPFVAEHVTDFDVLPIDNAPGIGGRGLESLGYKSIAYVRLERTGIPTQAASVPVKHTPQQILADPEYVAELRDILVEAANEHLGKRAA